MTRPQTITEIAKLLGEPRRRIDYIVCHYNVKPTINLRAVKLFDDAQITIIKEHLFNMQIQKRN